MSYMIRYKKRGTDKWYSIMDGNNVREFSEYDAHYWKERAELSHNNTHTYNVYTYDASAK